MYHKLTENGVLVMGVGTFDEKQYLSGKEDIREIDKKRQLHDEDDIKIVFETAGFESSKMTISATTDTMDSKDGKLIPGNYIVTAVK